MKPILFHDEAILELDDAIEWYNSRYDGLGLAMHAEVQTVLDRIAANPKSGSKYKSDGYRFCRTARFPYVIYWLELDDAIWIAAVAHARRRPDYWQTRKLTE